MNGQSSNKIRIPLPGGATFTGGGVLSHADWLGSYRLGTNVSARTLSFSVAYAPFGEQYAISGFNNNNFAFASLTEDDGLGGSPDLNDAAEREQHSNQGRWISPDPSGPAAVDMGNPQTWNRYAYVTNAPLNAVDPLGLFSDATNTGLPFASTQYCGGGNFFQTQLDASNQNIDFSFDKYVDWNNHQTFGDHY